MREAASQLIEVQWFYAQRGWALSTAAIAGAQRFVHWRHYPAQDIYDSVQGTRGFYHAHEEKSEIAGEHGHFHLFNDERDCGGVLAHIVGISLDRHGIPTRLFTTNQWVTGESMQDARKLIAKLGGFVLGGHGRMAPVARWLTAMTAMYRDFIAELLMERDVYLDEYAKRRGITLTAAKTDRNVQVTSQKAIHFLDDLQVFAQS